MTTITIQEDLKIEQKEFKNIQDFLLQIAYEEQLEEKLQIAKKSNDSDFVNL